MSELRLFFAGDFCSKPSTSLISVSDELRSHIGSCDIKVLNFEAPLKQDGAKLPPYNRERFYQNDDAPSFLKELGFNLFSGANNHAFDQGDEGWAKTKAAFGDALIGAGVYDDAYRIKIIERNGIKVGFMALAFATNLGSFARPSQRGMLGCAYIDDLRVNHDILAARDSVDFLFVLPHAGKEYTDAPLPEIIARYRDFIDYGADGVIASHPHYPQGWEEYKGKPIFYSLGNFFFNSKECTSYRVNREHWYQGLCVEMTLSDEGISYETVNVRNIDNLALEVDHGESFERHIQVCRNYLSDMAAYEAYIRPIIDRKTALYKSKIGAISVDDSIKGSCKALWAALKGRKFKRTRIEERDYYSLTKALIEILNCN